MADILSYKKTLCSPELERHCLSGFLKYSNVFPEIDGYIKETDFVHQSHRIIYQVAKGLRAKNEKFDSILLGQKIKELGVTFKDDIDIFSYIDILFSSQISFEATIQAFKELEKTRILLELCSQSDKVKEFVLQNRDKPISEIISEVDKLNNEKIDFKHIAEPFDLYDGLWETIEAKSLNPSEINGLSTGYPLFDKFFGELNADAGIFSIISRPGIGKSTWLLNIGLNVVSCNPGTKVLFLDVEMKSDISKLRLASSLSGVGTWYLNTGNWIKDETLKQKVVDNLKEIGNNKGKIFHLYIGSREIDEVLSIVRKWYYKYVGKGNKALVIYDYIKLGNERLRENWSEHQAIGGKVNKLTDFSLEHGLPIFVAMQQNRSAEGKDASDDSSTISLSDRLHQMAAMTAIFRRKTLKEIAEYGLEFGSHLLKPLKLRQQGKEGFGHNNLVNIGTMKKPKFIEFFINYDVNFFKVIEKGTAKDIATRLKEQYALNKKDKKGDNDESNPF